MILGREYSECGFVPAGGGGGLEGSNTDIDFDAGSLVVVPTSLPLLAGPGAISLVVADSPAPC
jgi:hypothetical protein